MAHGLSTPTFRKRTQRHTVIIARGETVRHFSVGHGSLLCCSVLALAVCAAAIAVPAWFILKGDPTNRLVDEQWKIADSYERRIDDLRTKLDQAVSRRFLSEKMVETKVDVLLGQQEDLEARYEKLDSIFDLAEEAGIIRSAVPRPSPRAAAISSMGVEGSGNRDDDTAAGPDPSVASLHTASTAASDGALSSEAIETIAHSIDRSELKQVAGLTALARKARERTVRISAALASVGVALPSAADETAQGGPFIPASDLAPSSVDAAFERSYGELSAALVSLKSARDVAEAMPLAQPMPSRFVSSGFGMRTDPFLGRPALHSGIDYAVAEGTPVRAQAAGTVVRASLSGGYGNMVEIDHGNGITTRYAHLSTLAVRKGQRIGSEQTVGTVGSTGRSTGAHLHYEIRVDGKPIDPTRFYHIGEKLALTL